MSGARCWTRLRFSESRALAARATYLAADRPDIGNAVKELCSGTSASRRRRCLLQLPWLEWTYPDGQAEVDVKNIHPFTDPIASARGTQRAEDL